MVEFLGKDITSTAFIHRWQKGIEALREIRKDASLEDIPVIMLTSSDADRDVLASFQGRANSYLGKPLTMKSLLDAVERIRNFRPEIRRVPGHGS